MLFHQIEIIISHFFSIHKLISIIAPEYLENILYLLFSFEISPMIKKLGGSDCGCPCSPAPVSSRTFPDTCRISYAFPSPLDLPFAPPFIPAVARVTKESHLAINSFSFSCCCSSSHFSHSSSHLRVRCVPSVVTVRAN